MEINILFFFLILFVFSISLTNAQQAYVNNEQLDCYNNISFINGYYCNGPQRSCNSYLTFRAQHPYNSAKSIARLLRTKPSKIIKINNLTNAVEKIPFDTMVIVPIRCSCSGSYYQHNTSYLLNKDEENYFTMANNTYQGLTTCQSLIGQNPDHDSRELYPGLNLTVPLRCACPSRKQTSAGFKFLLTYLITWGEDVELMAEKLGFGCGEGSSGGVNPQSILEANELAEDTVIYPFTPILIPLKTEPKFIKGAAIPLPPPAKSSDLPPVLVEPNPSNKHSKKWVSTGVGIGILSGLFVLGFSGFMIWFLVCRHPSQQGEKPQIPDVKVEGADADSGSTTIGNANKLSVSSEGVRDAMGSLILYKFDELQNATTFFCQANRIKGSVYHGVINGDTAAIKRTKQDVSDEINILKKINHSNVIRLSGFCVHDGNTFLVYEFAENGSLSDWLHRHPQGNSKKKNQRSLGWKQRVQIAYQVADGLNYLHNATYPPYIHKNLKSSNILLDSSLTAKITNFGVARSVAVAVATNLREEEGEGGGLQMQSTMHVVGTQGYMAPEYLEVGLITSAMDVFAFGVIVLELLSGKEAVAASGSSVDGRARGDVLLSELIKMVLDGENMREKLIDFIDPSLKQEYPFELVWSMAQLAMDCVASDLNSRPTMLSVFMSMSKILSSSLDWEPPV